MSPGNENTKNSSKIRKIEHPKNEKYKNIHNHCKTRIKCITLQKYEKYKNTKNTKNTKKRKMHNTQKYKNTKIQKMQSTTNTINAPNTNAKYINTGWVGRPGLLLWQGWLSLALSRLKDCRAHSQPCALHAYTARLDILSKKTYTHIYVYVVYTYMYTYISYTSTLPH